MDFDFMSIAIILGGVSIGLIGVAMVGNMLWPEWANKSKQSLQTLIVGFILLAIGAAIIEAFSG
jgi:hypothetical protein